MDAQPPEPGTYAARAAYWGDRVCRFCDHHNPAAAKFCNDCGLPLHLKPCNECDAVNQLAATNCHKCGAEDPASTRPDPALPGVDSSAASGTTTDAYNPATAAQPLFAASAVPAERRLRPGPVIAIATILIASAYGAYWIATAAPDVVEVVLQPIPADGDKAPAAAAGSAISDSEPLEPETTAALEAPIHTINPGPATGASARQRPTPVPATKQAKGRQRPPQLQAPVATKRAVAQSPRDAGVGTPVAPSLKAEKRDPRQAMHVSLARCGGDLVARIVCDQRVRQHFCEGHWGEGPECASYAHDRGQ